jgi:uncharacterized protein YwgA
MRGTQEGDRLVAEVVAAAGGQIVGRVRLQKIFYLLDRIGLGSGFDYEYHHYGPYSSELAEAVEDATAFGHIGERICRRSYDGVPYSIFENPRVRSESHLGALDQSYAANALKRMQAEPATVLELAATIDWLASQEQISDWRSELVRRKGAKAERSRVERAERLLHDLNMEN